VIFAVAGVDDAAGGDEVDEMENELRACAPNRGPPEVRPAGS